MERPQGSPLHPAAMLPEFSWTINLTPKDCPLRPHRLGGALFQKIPQASLCLRIALGDRPCKPGARLDDVMGKSERRALLGTVGASGQYHVDDSGSADQPRQTHRS